MTRKWPLRDALGWKTQLGLSVGFAIVLGLVLLLPINDCVVGGIGDVSGILRTTWAFVTGSATLISFGITAKKYRAETPEPARSEEPTDSHTAIHVEGIEGDVDLSVTLGETQSERPNESSVSRSSKTDDSDYTGENRPNVTDDGGESAE